jgi:PAS domain-containing protein
MEDKSLITKSGKSTSKKRKPNTTPPPLVSLEQQLMPSNKVFDAIPLAIISVDWKGQIQYMNQAAKSMLGEPKGLLRLEEVNAGFYLDDGLMPYPLEKLSDTRYG